MRSDLNYQQLSGLDLDFFVEEFHRLIYKAGECDELKGGITRLRPQEQTCLSG